MTIFVLAVGIVALAMLSLGLGVLLGKRTPLKGECHGFDPDRPPGASCSSCTCGATPLFVAPNDENPNQGEADQ